MDWYQNKNMVSPFQWSQGFDVHFDKDHTLQKIRMQKQEPLQNDANKSSQQPAKRQAKKKQNQTQLTPKENENPQLLIAITVGEVSKQRGDLSTLTGRSKGSLSTWSSSKKQWAVHLDSVKSVLCTNIPRKWIQDHKFSNHLLTDSILKPYLKQIDPDIPLVINIAPGLSKKKFVDLTFTTHMTPLFDEWRHRTQSAMKNMCFSEWTGNGQFVICSCSVTMTLTY